MVPVLTPGAMKDADTFAMESLGIPSIVLMENAARSAAEYIRTAYALSRDDHMLILCGSGNNGGDGFALARHLSESTSVSVLFSGARERMSHETKINATICQQLGIPVIEWDGNTENLPDATFIIDALVGIGSQGSLRSPLDRLVRWANEQSAQRIALDIPSGLDAESGIAYEPCFRADVTITMGALKTGLIYNHAPDYCGKLHIASIGIPSAVISDRASAWLVEEKDMYQTYRARHPRTTKFDYGRVLVIAGSDRMPGAAALCANGAITAGAGLVELITPSVHPALFPEVMPTLYNAPVFDLDALPLILARIERASVVVLGPGIGSDPRTLDLTRHIIEHCSTSKPLVVDADALRAITPTMHLPMVTITPHRAELARIFGIHPSTIETTAHEKAKALSHATGATVILKDFPIQICDGKTIYLATWYNPALACGGTGDVLAGIVAALWAQGYSQLTAAWLGVALHAHAGAKATALHGELATRAMLVIDALSTTSRLLTNTDDTES